MSSLRLVLFLSLLSVFTFGQTSRIKATDKYTALINEKYRNDGLKKKEPEGKRTLAGTVTGYYMKNKLVLIKTHLADEFSYKDYFFYVENDSLLFASVKHVTLKEPVTEKEYADYEKYVLFNTDHKGDTDIKKWPLTLDMNNGYYIDNAAIVQYKLNNFGKQVKASEAEIEETTIDLITRFAVHLEELSR